MRIFLDYQSTTPCDKEVLKEMLPYFSEKFGNPHSNNHSFGFEAEVAIDIAREKVAKVISAKSKEIIFTSGATESNNIAIQGVMNFYEKKHIITVATEHKSVLNICKYLETQGYKVTYLPVQQNGIVDLDILEKSISDDTGLISIMAVNSEIGVIQPLKEIGQICRKHNVLFHSDIAQGFGKIHLDVDEMNIDLASISGHKIYGPKGVGALYVRSKPKVRLKPLYYGGGQEKNIRPGTVPTPLVVGLGKASEIAISNMDNELAKLRKLYNMFVQIITNSLPEVYLNGDDKKRHPGNVNLSFACVEGESIMLAVRNLAISSGSACTSAVLEGSYVLKALGKDENLIHTSLRFGFGRYTTEQDIIYAANLIVDKVNKLRKLSPLWEMHQSGIDLKNIDWKEH